MPVWPGNPRSGSRPRYSCRLPNPQPQTPVSNLGFTDAELRTHRRGLRFAWLIAVIVLFGVGCCLRASPCGSASPRPQLPCGGSQSPRTGAAPVRIPQGRIPAWRLHSVQNVAVRSRRERQYARIVKVRWSRKSPRSPYGCVSGSDYYQGEGPGSRHILRGRSRLMVAGLFSRNRVTLMLPLDPLS